MRKFLFLLALIPAIAFGQYYGPYYDPTAVEITGGTITGINPPIPVASGGTGLGTLGTPGQVPTVNPGGTALIWSTPSGTGTVTSIGVSSSTLSVSGSPITSTGNIAVNLPNVSGVAYANGASAMTAATGAQIATALGTTNISGSAANVTGVVGYAHGGTGLSTLGAAGQVPTVNAGGTAIVWATPSGGSGGGAVTILCRKGGIQSVTGTTVDTVIDTCTVPANTLGVNGEIEIESAWSWTNNADNKTPAVKINGASVMTIPTQTTNNSGQWRIRFMNRGVTNQQASYASSNPYGVSSAPMTVTNFDTTSALSITFECTLATAADTCSLENYIVKAYP